MLTREATQIESLGSCRVRSPQTLATQRGQGIGTFVSDTARVRFHTETDTAGDPLPEILFEKAGPRDRLFFDPQQVTAAVVTCGGLCPGLNNVIRSLFLELHHNYGVRRILGIRYGYAGLNPGVGLPPCELNAELVEDIHREGGTLLGTSRGPQSVEVMVDSLVDHKVGMLFCVGGDGTLRGARDLAQEARRRGLPLAVVGIPKTIDNDVMYMTRTFGFSTAMAMASEVLACAHAEAHSVFNGVGLVKIMGRQSGFVAATATLASQEVNFCLIPEVPFALAGVRGLFAALEHRLAARRHAVIAVAEGAGQDLLAGRPQSTDASGNPVLGDIGVFLKDELRAHFKRVGMPIELKYFDPSYLVRSVAANPDDAILCDQLARHAVHAALAGKTNVVVGFWNGTFTHIPIALAVSEKRHVDPEGQLWTSVLATTGQHLRLQ